MSFVVREMGLKPTAPGFIDYFEEIPLFVPPKHSFFVIAYHYYIVHKQLAPPDPDLDTERTINSGLQKSAAVISLLLWNVQILH